VSLAPFKDVLPAVFGIDPSLEDLQSRFTMLSLTCLLPRLDLADPRLPFLAEAFPKLMIVSFSTRVRNVRKKFLKVAPRWAHIKQFAFLGPSCCRRAPSLEDIMHVYPELSYLGYATDLKPLVMTRGPAARHCSVRYLMLSVQTSPLDEEWDALARQLPDLNHLCIVIPRVADWIPAYPTGLIAAQIKSLTVRGHNGIQSISAFPVMDTLCVGTVSRREHVGETSSSVACLCRAIEQAPNLTFLCVRLPLLSGDTATRFVSAVAALRSLSVCQLWIAGVEPLMVETINLFSAFAESDGLARPTRLLVEVDAETIPHLHLLLTSPFASELSMLTVFVRNRNISSVVGADAVVPVRDNVQVRIIWDNNGHTDIFGMLQSFIYVTPLFPALKRPTCAALATARTTTSLLWWSGEPHGFYDAKCDAMCTCESEVECLSFDAFGNST
jgi:hypothetical protein